MPTGLPPGLQLEAFTGLVSGTPTEAGAYTIPVLIYDGTGGARAFDAALDVLEFDPPSSIAIFTNNGTVDRQFLTVGRSSLWSFAIQIPSGVGQQITAVTASIRPSSPGLPAGFSLGSPVILSGGLLAAIQAGGTPTTALLSEYGRRRMVIQLNWDITRGANTISGFTRWSINANFQPRTSVEGDYGLVIVNRQNSVPLLRGGGDPGIQGGHEPRRVTLLPGSQLPAGLSLNATTGAIVGSPVQIGSWPVGLLVQDAAGDSRTLEGVILRTDIIYEPPQFVGIPGNTSQTFERENGQLTLLPDYSAFSVRSFLPFQVEWVRTSGSTDISPVAPQSLTTGFSCSVPAGQSRTTTFRIDIWDERTQRGQVSLSVVITATNAYAQLALSAVPTVTVGGTRKIGQPPASYSALVPLTGGVRPYSQIAISTPQPMFGNVVAVPRPVDGGILFAGANGDPVLPAQAGFVSFMGTVVDGSGLPRAIGRTFRCVDPPSIQGPTALVFRVGVNTSFNLLAVDGNRESGGGQAFSISTSPPSGLAFSPGGLSCSIGGTPTTTSGAVNRTLTYRDGPTLSAFTNEAEVVVSVRVEASIGAGFAFVGPAPANGDPFILEITPSAGAGVSSLSLRDIQSPVVTPSVPAAINAVVTVSGTRSVQAIVMPQVVAEVNDLTGAPPATVSFAFP
jgi:hypothetical protein